MTTPDNENYSSERRHSIPNKHILWSQLSVTQQAAVSSLDHYGYELSFIRDTDSGMQVVMLMNGAPASIDEDGNINPQPDIAIRK
jgi:hypothetical protein